MKDVLFILLHAAIYIHAQVIDDLPSPEYNEAIDRGKKGFYPTRDFKTFNDNVKTPVINFRQWSPQCDDGLRYFISPRGYSLKEDKVGPMILDSRGELIWAEQYSNVGNQAYNFMVQPFKGEDHLTFWVGEDRVSGHGAGFYYFLNSSYDVVDKFGGAHGSWADLHEFSVTQDDTALVSVYDVVQSNSTLGGQIDDPNGLKGSNSVYVWDSVIQEIDLTTHELRWQWRATEHVDTSDSYRPDETKGTEDDAYDWFHINSAQKDELGNYLLSARFLHSIIYVDGRTKETIWRLGGKQNSFMDLSNGNATNFAWQHDARIHPTDTFPNLYHPPQERSGFTTKLLTLFDNASENEHYHYGLSLSRGLLLELTYPTPGTEKAMAGPQSILEGGIELERDQFPDFSDLDFEKIKAINGSDPNYTVRVIMSYESPTGIRSSSQGNMQLIPQAPGEDPKVLIGYGLAAAWTEFASNGTVLCDVHYGARTSFETGQIDSYRVFKLPWTGKPKWKPKLVLDRNLHVSWIGATEVAEWIVQSSLTGTRNETGWRDILRIRKRLFEEKVPIPNSVGGARYLRVIALDASGAKMEQGVSDVVDRGALASSFSSITGHVGENATYPLLLEVCLILACPAVLYGAYRRFLSGRTGRLGMAVGRVFQR